MKNIEIKEIHRNKKDFLPLLLIGDEEEKMIDKYLNKCRVFAAFDNETAVGIIAVCGCENRVCEIKNIAINEKYRKKGLGRLLIRHTEKLFRDNFDFIQAGTGESPLTVPFYEKCGFEYSHRTENFFTDNYENPIIEAGVVLKDMVYYRKKL